jgi:RIO kinase 2
MILEEVGKAYSLGIVHADLSEFNVMITEEGLKIIDWPQAVDLDHANSQELLERDLTNILRFFARRYKIDLPLEEALSRVKAEPNAKPDANPEAEPSEEAVLK